MIMPEISLENWKDYRKSEADLLFPIGSIVIYDFAACCDSTMNAALVRKITPSGILYVSHINVNEVDRNKLKKGQDYQMGGWRRFDPNSPGKISTEQLKFIPNFKEEYKYYKNFNPEHPISWNNNKNYYWDLRPAEIDKDGLIKLVFGSTY